MKRKKIKYILLFLLAIAIGSGYSQTEKIDSLKLELTQVDEKDQIPILLDIANEMSEFDLNASLKYTFEALKLANLENEKDNINKCHQYLGSFYLSKGNIEEALKHLHISLNLMTSDDKDHDFCLLYNNLGTTYSRKGVLDSALFYHKAAYNLSVESLDTNQQISSLRSIGNVYYKKGEFDKALIHFRNGISLAEYISNQEEKSHLLNNLGILYSDWGEYDLSLRYYKNALRIMDSLEKHFDMGRIFNNMGNIFWYKESYDSALIFYNKSLKKREQLGDNNGKAYVLNNLGMIYGSMGNFDLSLEYFNQSLNLFEKMDNNSGVVMTNYNIAFVYMELEDFTNAEKYLHQGLIIAEKQGFTDYVTANLDALGELYKTTEEWENAFYTLEKYKNITDSIRNQQNMDIIKELEIKYENEKYKADLSILQNQIESTKIKQNQNIITISGIVIIIILILLSTYFIIVQIKNRSNTEYNKLTPALLRYQMNPQFINSSLSGIKELISKNRIKESVEFLSGFSKLMRVFIESSGQFNIVLEKEIETIQQFLSLHKLRYEHVLNFQLDVDEHLEPEILAVPPLLLFPVYSKIIDYYLLKGEVNINHHIYAKKELLFIEVYFSFIAEDDFRKTHENDLKENIQFVSSRVQQINKQLKSEIVFKSKWDLKDIKNSLELSLAIPIQPI